MTPLPCQLRQWIAARHLDDGTEPPRWVSRHLDHCAACRAQHERHRRLIARLVGDAKSMRREPPPFLRVRILANLDTPGVAANSGRRRFSPAWGIAAVGAVAVVLLLALPRPPQPAPPGTSGMAQGNPAPGRVVLAALPALPAQEAVLALGANLDAPLESELRLVMDDARTALSALSRNFLPAEFTEPRR